DDPVGPAGGATHRDRRRRHLLLPVRLVLHCSPHARDHSAEAVHHGRERDLADAAAGMPASWSEDRRDQRTDLGTFVSALSAHPAVLQASVVGYRSLLRPGRRDMWTSGGAWRRA